MNILKKKSPIILPSISSTQIFNTITMLLVQEIFKMNKTSKPFHGKKRKHSFVNTCVPLEACTELNGPVTLQEI